MDVPRAYGFHSGLPWPHPRVSCRMETKRGRSRAEQDSGEAILSATRGGRCHLARRDPVCGKSEAFT
jgi:hypothetical protein